MPAFIPLNSFKTVTTTIPYIHPDYIDTYQESDHLIYTAPRGVTSIVLMAQAANTGDDGGTSSISVVHYRPNKNAPNEPWDSPNSGAIKKYILKYAPIPPNDSLLLLPGKLVLETRDRLYMFADRPQNSGASSYIDVVCSILETANQ